MTLVSCGEQLGLDIASTTSSENSGCSRLVLPYLKKFGLEVPTCPRIRDANDCSDSKREVCSVNVGSTKSCSSDSRTVAYASQVTLAGNASAELVLRMRLFGREFGEAVAVEGLDRTAVDGLELSACASYMSRSADTDRLS